MATRWIVHDMNWGYLSRPEHPTEWGADKGRAYRFRHKRDALSAIARFAPRTRERFLVEPLQVEMHEVLFD